MSKSSKNSPRPIRVVLVGGQHVIIAGLSLLLKQSARFNVVGESVIHPQTKDADVPVPSIWGTWKNIDVIIFDIDDDAESLLRVLSPSVPRGTRMMLLGSRLDQQTLALAFRLGVTGAVLKQEAPEVFMEAITMVHDGQVWLDQSSTTQLVTGLSTGPQPMSREAKRATSLTRRERQVTALVGEGLRNVQIARRLSISDVTVRNHLTSVFRKLRLSSRFQLALYAFKYGLSKVPPTFRPAARRPARATKSGKRTAS